MLRMSIEGTGGSPEEKKACPPGPALFSSPRSFAVCGVCTARRLQLREPTAPGGQQLPSVPPQVMAQ